MKQNEIKNAVEKINLSNDAALRIEYACRAAETREERGSAGAHIGVRLAIAAACVLVLSIGVYATAQLVGFYMERDGDNVNIGATLDRENPAESEGPNRAWNANEDEVMIKLDFSYMPEDITPDLTANGKYDGAENNRAMTFSGFDLRICDLNTVIGNIAKAEEFMAGENRAFLLTSESEIAVYNKALYVLFEDEQLVIKATVGCGITEDELKAIAAGLSVVETDDVTLAIPISNEVGLGDISASVSDVLIIEGPKAYREDLISVGDSAHYDSYFHYDDVTVLGVEVFDNISSLNKNCLYSHGAELLQKMTDPAGNLIPYKRTEVDIEAGKFGETVEVTKKLIVVTYKCTEVLKTDEGEVYPMAFLNSFTFEKLIEKEDGTVVHDETFSRFVIDRTPGTHSGTAEPIYGEQIDGDTYRYAYLIDEDQLDGELFLASYYAEIYYLIPVEDLIG